MLKEDDDNNATDNKAVHNDFHESHGIFPLFKNLEVKNFDVPSLKENGDMNGTKRAGAVTNGDAS